MPNTTCPAGCPCRTADPRNERALADDGLAVCSSCLEPRHAADVASYRTGPRTTRTLCRTCAVELGLAEGEDEAPTAVEPYETLAALVFGGLRAAVVLLGLALGGCRATTPAAVEVENVGTLSAARGSVVSAPVHASSDLSIAYQAVDGDEAPAVGEPSGNTGELPEVSAKGGGLVAGASR